MDKEVIKLHRAVQEYEALGCFALAQFFRNLIYSAQLAKGE